MPKIKSVCLSVHPLEWKQMHSNTHTQTDDVKTITYDASQTQGVKTININLTVPSNYFYLDIYMFNKCFTISLKLYSSHELMK